MAMLVVLVIPGTHLLHLDDGGLLGDLEGTVLARLKDLDHAHAAKRARAQRLMQLKVRQSAAMSAAAHTATT